MTYFLHDAPLEPGARVELRGDEAHHLLRVRRVRVGERFALQDPQGRRFEAELLAAERQGSGALRHGASVAILAPLPVPPAPPVRVTLLQAALKDKAAELLIEKCTELGVAALCIFPVARSSVAHAALAAEKTRARWQRMALEACKQSDRQFPPDIRVVRDLPAALAAHPAGNSVDAARGWVLHPDAERTAAGTLRGAAPSALHVLIGPEGGLTDEEVAAATAAGYTPVRLGGTILRAETAALAACTLAVLGAA